VAARLRRRFAAISLVVSIAIAYSVAGCAATESTVRPSASLAPRPTITPAVAATLSEVTRLLGQRSLQVRVPQVLYRPGEAAEVASASRAVVQAILPDDPDHGYITVYDFPDADTAQAAAESQARYVASGPGRVQFPPDARFTIRRSGSTVLFYAFSPGASTDERAPEIEAVLRTFGIEVDVPS
jgi:hypothetical protein